MDIKTSSELAKELNDINQRVIICGHSHTPRIIYLSSSKMIINPGSVGLPAYEDELPYYHVMESGSPHAKYSIITKEDINIKVENIALPYCFEQAAECAIRRNRPDWQRALLSGRF